MTNQELELRKNIIIYNGIQKYEIGINLTKDMQDLYTANCESLLMEVEEDLNKLRKLPYYG